MTEYHEHKPAPVEWFALTIDCPEPSTLAEFYAAALGGTITHRTRDSTFVQVAGL